MDRKTAIQLISENEYYLLKVDEKINMVVDYWYSFEHNNYNIKLVNFLKNNEPEDTEYYKPIFKELVIFGLSEKNSYFNNIYLSSKLSSLLNQSIIVDGNEKEGKVRCPLCNFFTLRERMNYEICIVCKWEDDGTELINFNKYSSSNHDYYNSYQQKFMSTENIESLRNRYIY